METSQSLSQGNGKLYIVGTGPGSPEYMTVRAMKAIAGSDVVIGNALYLDMLEPLLKGKTVVRSSMGEEVDRARKSVEMARSCVVSIVSGGDAGVYGMAGIVLEVLKNAGIDVPFEVIPGVTAANAAASLLGSPLSGDFVTMSLSDLLTPMDVIEKRLGHAFSMGVPVVLYNPRSHNRPDNLTSALKIAGKHLDCSTPVGIVRDAYREGQTITVKTLIELTEANEFVDMHSIVIVGGVESMAWQNDHMLTQRGYQRKYVY
jgi:precorrin-3B C17-methyltransferase